MQIVQLQRHVRLLMVQAAMQERDMTFSPVQVMQQRLVVSLAAHNIQCRTNVVTQIRYTQSERVHVHQLAFVHNNVLVFVTLRDCTNEGACAPQLDAAQQQQLRHDQTRNNEQLRVEFVQHNCEAKYESDQVADCVHILGTIARRCGMPLDSWL